MALTMHSASVPVLARMLRNMNSWLDKAVAHAEAKKFDPAVYLTARLAPDMLPFTRQIQIASDNAKGCVARLAGVEIPKFEDNETTLEQLRERIAKTLAFIESVPVSAFEGAETREVQVPRRDKEPLRFSGEDYLRFFALPNFFFHATTTYALLRHWGVDLGKPDYLRGGV
ncbi:MAG: DUF1993 domain-containing protein [Pseudomonadota bacterium]